MKQRRGSKQLYDDDEDEEISKYFKTKPENQVVKLGQYFLLTCIVRCNQENTLLQSLLFDVVVYFWSSRDSLVVSMLDCQ